MPIETNTSQILETNTDPRVYIQNLVNKGPSMVTKTQAEKDRAEAILKLPKYIRDQTTAEKKDIDKLRGFVNETEIISQEMSVSAERAIEAKGLEKEPRKDAFKEFSKDLEQLDSSFRKALPEAILAISKKNPEAKVLKEEIGKITKFMDSLGEIKNALTRSEYIYESLPKEILESFEIIRRKADLNWIAGDEKSREVKDLEGSDPKRVKKLKEIVDNAKKNIEPLQRTMGRNFSETSARIINTQKLSNVIGPDKVAESIKIIKQDSVEGRELSNAEKETIEKKRPEFNKIYPDKVEERITNNMQEQNKTPEEISKAIETAKKGINDAIEKEKQESIPVTITPSSYTTPQP